MQSRILLMSLAAGLALTSGTACGEPRFGDAAKIEMTGCRQQNDQATADRCYAVTVRGQQIVSDHGAGVGESYDAQGNPLDRHGNVVAVPENTATGRALEVFADYAVDR